MFWNRFYDLCEKYSTKPNPLAKDLGISSGVITKWKNGGIPNGETLIKISDYFNCSIDYLLGKSNNPNRDLSVNSISNSTITGNAVVQGNNNNNTNMIVNNNDTKKKELSKQALEFAEIFDSLGIRQQAKLLSTLDELEKELKKNL